MSNPKYYLNELSCFITDQPYFPLPIYGVSVDSRLARKGDLFFALPGSQLDGHCFLADAKARGCVAAVVMKAYQGPDYGLILIKVDDTLRALQEVARQILAIRHPKIIAVTGSVGKTTTKEFIAGLLQPSFKIVASPGNSNSQIGLPLTILNHTGGQEEILVLEMGMAKKGEISQLIEIAPPDISIITTVALVHACNFECIDDIGRAKAEIFTHPKTSIGLLDRRIDNFEELCKVGACQKLSFAVASTEADFSLTGDNLLKCPDGRFCVPQMHFPGVHNRHNFLAAVAVARCLKLEWEEINAAAMSLNLPEMRLEIVEKCGVKFVNDSYNASEISTKAALDSLPEPKAGGKKIAVIGEMLELGRFSSQCHTAVGQYALDKVDRIVCFGEKCQEIVDVWKAAGRTADLLMEREALIKTLKGMLNPGDVVLLKGSRSKGLWKVLDEIG